MTTTADDRADQPDSSRYAIPTALLAEDFITALAAADDAAPHWTTDLTITFPGAHPVRVNAHQLRLLIENTHCDHDETAPTAPTECPMRHYDPLDQADRQLLHALLVDRIQRLAQDPA